MVGDEKAGAHHRRVHFVQFGDQIGKELVHILLFSDVQRLVVHPVVFTEAFRVVGFPFA